jgi:hypothetical protein
MSTGLSAIAVKLTTLSSDARLSDLALFMTEGQVARAKKIRSVLGHLAPGVYLLRRSVGRFLGALVALGARGHALRRRPSPAF